MKPSPPVTRHRRPAKASTGMGSRARSVYGTASRQRLGIRDPTSRPRSPTRAPRRRPTSHIASSARRSPSALHLAGQLDRSPRSSVPRYSMPRASRTRPAEAPDAARPRPLRATARCSRGRARRSRWRAVATDARSRRRRRRVVHETAAHPAPAGRLAVEVEEVVVERERTPAVAVDEHPQRRPLRRRAPRSRVIRVRRSAQRGPIPLQNVASSTVSSYTGSADELEVARAQHPDAVAAPRARRRRRRRWPRPGGTAPSASRCSRRRRRRRRRGAHGDDDAEHAARVPGGPRTRPAPGSMRRTAAPVRFRIKRAHRVRRNTE